MDSLPWEWLFRERWRLSWWIRTGGSWPSPGTAVSCQEMETAVRLGVPIVVLIVNDGSYGLIKWKQEDRFGFHCDVDFGNPDFAAMAESMGVKGFRLNRTEDLIPTLEEAFEAGRPAIIAAPSITGRIRS